MSKYEGNDHYLYPSTDTLKNKLGITDYASLQKSEANLTAIQSSILEHNPIKGKFDLPHLQAIHRFLFRPVYTWAGKIRNVDISKSNAQFANHNHIVSAANALFKQLEKEQYLRNLPPEQFAARAAYYLGEINAIHPFREGNGRAQREFINHLAWHNGYYINWKNITQIEMYEASVESFHADKPVKLTELLFKSLTTL